MTNLRRRKTGSKVERLTVYDDTLLKSLPRSATEDDKHNLLECSKKYWTNCLDQWFSYIVFRAVGKSFDTYWIPPCSDNRITLRSAGDISRYIDHAIAVTNVLGSEQVCFETINKSWAINKKKQRK
jgi:hypothetical protein